MTVYTIREVAKMLKVHEGTVRRWISEKKIKSIKFAETGFIRISQESLDEFLCNSQNKVA